MLTQVERLVLWDAVLEGGLVEDTIDWVREVGKNWNTYLSFESGVYGEWVGESSSHIGWLSVEGFGAVSTWQGRMRQLKKVSAGRPGPMEIDFGLPLPLKIWSLTDTIYRDRGIVINFVVTPHPMSWGYE